MDLFSIPSILLAIFSLAMLVGGIFAFKYGRTRMVEEVQDRVINALKTRVETLESQAASDSKELLRLRQVINTIRHALKRRGLLIEIEGEFVTLTDVAGQTDSTQAAKGNKTNIAKVQPIKLQPIDDDDDTAS
jgi:hypothetical protein